MFHFKDGSTHDEEAVFSQQQDFRLIRDHLVQKGPWILEGDAPAFIPSEQQLYPDGPLWRIELVSPAFTAP